MTDQQLEQKFKGKHCSYSFPGYKTVYGMVDEICIDVLNPQEVILQINNRRYTMSAEDIDECLKLLKNGDT